MELSAKIKELAEKKDLRNLFDAVLKSLESTPNSYEAKQHIEGSYLNALKLMKMDPYDQNILDKTCSTVFFLWMEYRAILN